MGKLKEREGYAIDKWWAPESSGILLGPIGYNTGMENTDKMHCKIFFKQKVELKKVQWKSSYYHHLEKCFLTWICIQLTWEYYKYGFWFIKSGVRIEILNF